MQLAWLTAAALGLCLGFVLDGCVSLRNQACALARQRLASPGYWAVWLGALLVMAVRLWTDHDVWFL